MVMFRSGREAEISSIGRSAFCESIRLVKFSHAPIF